MIETESNAYALTSATRISNSLSRNFAYTLSDKKATTNLLKAAAREPLETLEKQKCMVYDLSVGAYMKVVFPLLNDWNNNKRLSDTYDVTVKSSVPGFDDKKRHVDTVIQFTINGLTTTLSAFNTTQRLKVEGKGYLEFVKYLNDILGKKIENEAVAIDDYNKAVTAALSGKRKVVTRPLRSVRMKAISQFRCGKCGAIFQKNSQLNIHLKSVHTSAKLPFDRNESRIDDLSLMDLSNDSETHAVLELEESCSADDLSSPTDKVNIELDLVKQQPALLPNNSASKVMQEMSVRYSCPTCESSFDSKRNLEIHEQQHTSIQAEEIQIQDPSPVRSIKAVEKVHPN